MIKLVSKINPKVYTVIEENENNFEESRYGFTVTLGEAEDSDVLYLEKDKWRKESFSTNEKTLKTPLYYCKANSTRGKEVISALEENGGVNIHGYKGNASSSFCYFIDPYTKDIEMTSYLFFKRLLEDIGTEIKLPDRTQHVESVILKYVTGNTTFVDKRTYLKNFASEVLEAAKKDLENK